MALPGSMLCNNCSCIGQEGIIFRDLTFDSSYLPLSFVPARTSIAIVLSLCYLWSELFRLQALASTMEPVSAIELFKQLLDVGLPALRSQLMQAALHCIRHAVQGCAADPDETPAWLQQPAAALVIEPVARFLSRTMPQPSPPAADSGGRAGGSGGGGASVQLDAAAAADGAEDAEALGAACCVLRFLALRGERGALPAAFDAEVARLAQQQQQQQTPVPQGETGLAALVNKLAVRCTAATQALRGDVAADPQLGMGLALVSLSLEHLQSILGQA
jgi:hypothetical protein